MPQKIKNRPTIWSSNSTSGCITKGRKTPLSKRHLYIPCLLLHYSQQPRHKKTPVSVNGWMDKGDVVYICNGILIRHKKEGNPAICDMNEPWGHYAEWNKSDRERQIPNDLTYTWNLKELNPSKQRTDWWLPESRGDRGGEEWAKQVKVVKSYKFPAIRLKFWGCNATIK